MRFVLVHGGMHVAAHFDLLAAELRADGHEVVAPDLPGRGDRAGEKATWEGCREAVADVIENGEQLAHEAYKRLVPEQLDLVLEPLPLPKFRDLNVPRDYIVCLDDRSGINARIETYLSLLGLRQAHLLWSSHSPFLSRPRDTAGLLVAIGGRA